MRNDREHVDRLLAGTGMAFVEEPLGEQAWRFTTTEGDVEADVQIVDADPAAAAARLHEREGDLASYNGLIVFRVRYTGDDTGIAGTMRAATVAGALAGEE
jgi:hypothetical protein